MESRYRSIVKALTWSAGGLVLTAAIAWILTRRLDLAAAIGFFDTVVKIAAYYVHERAWLRVGFGKTAPGPDRSGP